MKWIDTGFLISKNKYNENSVIAEIFTLNNGKVTGIIFGASSKKIKSYLEIGNLLHVNYSSKSPEKIGSFKIELSKANTAYFFENKIKLHCIVSTMNLIRILTVENQSNKNLYNLINIFFENIKFSCDTPIPSAPPSDFCIKINKTKIIAKTIFNTNKIFSMWTNYRFF